MECDRLIKLIKSWYMQVQDEALAPARMVAFIERHVAECNTCLLDHKLKQEIAKITEIVLPPTKVRAGKKEADEDETADGIEEEAVDDTDDTDTDEDGTIEDSVVDEEEEEALFDEEEDEI